MKKQVKQERAGRVAQVEHLPSKHEALSSNTSTAKKPKEYKKKIMKEKTLEFSDTKVKEGKVYREI
jgi:hypothetical protein